MNKNLLNTIMVKSQLKRYLKLNYSLDEILKRLDEIHLIKISKQELKDFIDENELNELKNKNYIKLLLKSEKQAKKLIDFLKKEGYYYFKHNNEVYIIKKKK